MGRTAAQRPGPGIDRRSLIKRAAAAGTMAWTAPVIIESLSSPAGAITGTPGCFRFRVTAASCVSGTTASAIDTICDVSTTQCSTTNNTNTPFSNYCMTASTCTLDGAIQHVFTIDAGCSCTFLAARGSTDLNGCDQCVSATISSGNKVATFDPLPGDCNWSNWKFIVQCS